MACVRGSSRARAVARRRLGRVGLAGAGLLAGFAVPGFALAAEFEPPPAHSPVQTPPAPGISAPPADDDRPIAVNLVGRFGLALPPEKAARIQTTELARDHDLGLDGLTLKPGPAAEPHLTAAAAPGAPPQAGAAPVHRPWVVAMVENTGGEEAGPWRAGLTIGLPSLTKADEITRLGLFHSLVNDRQQAEILSSTLILNSRGLGFHADLLHVRFSPNDRVPASDNTLIRVNLVRAELDQAIWVRGADFAGLRAGLEVIDHREDYLTGPPSFHDRLRTAFAGATARTRRGSAYAEADLQVRKGLDILGASRPGDAFLSHSDEDPQALTLRYAAKAGLPVMGGILEARVRGQWTDRPIPVFDNLNYQGFETARAMDPMALRTDHGMDPRMLRADRGLIGGLEYSRAGPHILGGALSPFVFVDHAELRNLGLHGAPYGRATLAGGGLRLALPKRLDAELEYSAPVSPVVGLFSTDMGKPRLLFTLARRFGG